MQKIVRLISPSPIIFSLSFILFAYSQSITELNINALVAPLIAVSFFAVLTNLFFVKLLKSKDKGSLFSSVFLVLFFTYGNFFWQLDNNKIPLPSFLSSVDKNYIAQPIWIVFLVVAFFIIRKKIHNYNKVQKFVLFIATILFVNSFIQIAHYELVIRLKPVAIDPLKQPRVNINNISYFPDIYYIMPEDYSSPVIMKNNFNYDNSNFINFLKLKGFFVPKNSTSNYPKTFESLTSSLNMEYLNFLSIYKNSSDMTLVAPFIQNNNVLRFVKSLGYQYYHVGSWWEFTSSNQYADENFSFESQGSLPLDAFSCLILESTQAAGIFNHIPHLNCDQSDEGKEKIINYQFNTSSTVIQKSGPKFVFMHIIAPHGPYVFGKGCVETIDKNKLSKNEYVNYANQADCVDTKLEDLINTILAKSTQPPVIIIQSDEGAPFLNTSLNPWDDWGNASNTLLKEKFPIFNAYYLPKAPKNIIQDTITPVNSFRIVFNFYFHTNFRILHDKNYIFQDLNHLYNFTDVTNRIK